MSEKKDNPNVIAPPPLIFLSCLLLGGVVSWFYPFPILPKTLSIVLGIVLILAGPGIVFTAWQQMKQAKTNIEPWKPTTAILDTGLYGFSRNPIYFAMILIYLGVSFLFNSVWFLPFLPLAVLIIYFGVILREEKYLEDKFGADYLKYKAKSEALDMNLAVKITLLASGLFLLSGMLTGVWKYAKIMSSPEHRAPAYVDIAHRASFFYSFASLVMAKLLEFSPFPHSAQVLIAAFPLLYFLLTVIGYIREGFLNRTENMFAERTFITTSFMYGLIVGEIGGLLLILGGFIYTQFFI